MENARFAERLRQLRTRVGLSQEALAARAGMHRTYISQLERGLKSPTLMMLGRICQVLGVSVSSFIAEVEKP